MEERNEVNTGIIKEASDLRLLLSPRQAAKALSISEKTLYNYTKSA